LKTVAPRAGAWIETWIPEAVEEESKSRPARARGLKHASLRLLIVTTRSRPARARGLKHKAVYHHCPGCIVAPRAGAWIETTAGIIPGSYFDLSRPARARGLKPSDFAQTRIV